MKYIDVYRMIKQAAGVVPTGDPVASLPSDFSQRFSQYIQTGGKQPTVAPGKPTMMNMPTNYMERMARIATKRGVPSTPEDMRTLMHPRKYWSRFSITKRWKYDQ